MEKQVRKSASKGIQTFIDKEKINQISKAFINNYKINKTFNNKRKQNELFFKTKQFKEQEKYYRYNPINNNLDNIIDMKTSKLFNTELNSKNNLNNLRNKYSISINLGETKNKINTIKDCFKSPLKRKQEEIFHTVRGMCHNIYESKNIDNNSRMKLREEIIDKIQIYINTNLRKNVLCPQIIIRNKKNNKLITPNKIKRKLKSFDTNKMNSKSIVRNSFEETNEKYINLKNSRIVTYENYARNDTIFNHPQIYTLNNNFYKTKNPTSKTQKKLKSFLDFSKLIPERKRDQKEINKQIYSVYKTMKNKNEIVFHI